MGAVFALYSAWYFWIPKILGLDYNRLLGKVHFWVLFIGVNVTFFPQHFLGLQGMPRRISDYPDAFAGWNLISSFGSIISVVATWLFLHTLYNQLLEGKATSRYPWLTPQFYSDSLQTLLNRAYNSLEWCLNSPPKPHAFVSLPLQSRIIVLVKKSIKERFSKKNVFTCFIVLLTGFSLRYLILDYYGINVFLDYKQLISVYYYTFMALYTPLIKTGADVLESAIILYCQDNSSGGVGQGGSNTPLTGTGSGSGTNNAPTPTPNPNQNQPRSLLKIGSVTFGDGWSLDSTTGRYTVLDGYINEEDPNSPRESGPRDSLNQPYASSLSGAMHHCAGYTSHKRNFAQHFSDKDFAYISKAHKLCNPDYKTSFIYNSEKLRDFLNNLK